jgi:MinD-like ATPase involved in chromosome partitioning or flagellar assembly
VRVSPRRNGPDDDRDGIAGALARWDSAPGMMRSHPDATPPRPAPDSWEAILSAEPRPAPSTDDQWAPGPVPVGGADTDPPAGTAEEGAPAGPAENGAPPSPPTTETPVEDVDVTSDPDRAAAEDRPAADPVVGTVDSASDAEGADQMEWADPELDVPDTEDREVVADWPTEAWGGAVDPGAVRSPEALPSRQPRPEVGGFDLGDRPARWRRADLEDRKPVPERWARREPAIEPEERDAAEDWPTAEPVAGAVDTGPEPPPMPWQLADAEGPDPEQGPGGDPAAPEVEDREASGEEPPAPWQAGEPVGGAGESGGERQPAPWQAPWQAGEPVGGAGESGGERRPAPWRAPWQAGGAGESGGERQPAPWQAAPEQRPPWGRGWQERSARPAPWGSGVAPPGQPATRPAPWPQAPARPPAWPPGPVPPEQAAERSWQSPQAPGSVSGVPGPDGWRQAPPRHGAPPGPPSTPPPPTPGGPWVTWQSAPAPPPAAGPPAPERASDEPASDEPASDEPASDEPASDESWLAQLRGAGPDQETSSAPEWVEQSRAARPDTPAAQVAADGEPGAVPPTRSWPPTPAQPGPPRRSDSYRAPYQQPSGGYQYPPPGPAGYPPSAYRPPQYRAQPDDTGQRADSLPAPTVEDLTAHSLLRQRRPAPQAGWRRAVYTLSAHAVNPGRSPSELRRQAMIARAIVPVRGCYRIAVISLKGGVGKTTMTVCLGATLASLRGDRVIAVDANPDRGTLSGKIPVETVATVRNLVNDVDRIHHYFDVRRYSSQSPDRLEVLASDSDPAVSIAFSEQDYRTVAAILDRFYNIVLTDCGTGLLHSAMAGVLALADQIVLVSSGSVDGARSASATLDWLEAHGYDELVRDSVAVINSVRPKSGGVDLDKLEAHFAARCRAVARIPYDPHLEEGAEVDLGEMGAETRGALLELAAAVADGFGAGASTRGN